MRTHRIAAAASIAAIALAGAACSAESNYDELSPGQEAPADDGLGQPGETDDLGGGTGDSLPGGDTSGDTEGGAGTTGGQ